MSGDNSKAVAGGTPAKTEIPSLPEGLVVVVKTRGPSGPCPTLGIGKCVPGGHYTVPAARAAKICLGDSAEFVAVDAESASRIKAEQTKTSK